jgi:hypothetical protein
MTPDAARSLLSPPPSWQRATSDRSEPRAQSSSDTGLNLGNPSASADVDKCRLSLRSGRRHAGRERSGAGDRPDEGDDHVALGTTAGQVESSRQLFVFSAPGSDDVLSDDFGARLAESLDAQLFNGTGAARTLRGFLQTSGIISVTGSITNQAACLQSLWQGFSQVAGTSGYGSAVRAYTDAALVIANPKALAKATGGSSPAGY